MFTTTSKPPVFELGKVFLAYSSSLGAESVANVRFSWVRKLMTCILFSHSKGISWQDRLLVYNLVLLVLLFSHKVLDFYLGNEVVVFVDWVIAYILGAVRFTRLYAGIKYVLLCIVHEIEFHNSILDYVSWLFCLTNRTAIRSFTFGSYGCYFVLATLKTFWKHVCPFVRNVIWCSCFPFSFSPEMKMTVLLQFAYKGVLLHYRIASSRRKFFF